jgi:hypothetical protein
MINMCNLDWFSAFPDATADLIVDTPHEPHLSYFPKHPRLDGVANKRMREALGMSQKNPMMCTCIKHELNPSRALEITVALQKMKFVGSEISHANRDSIVFSCKFPEDFIVA